MKGLKIWQIHFKKMKNNLRKYPDLVQEENIYVTNNGKQNKITMQKIEDTRYYW